jgi:YVTN family beta-propeller protein
LRTTNPGPAAIAVDETDNLVYVANSADGSVSTLDGATGAEVTGKFQDFGDGSEPMGLAWDSALDIVYVAVYGKDRVIPLNGATGDQLPPIIVDPGPVALAYDAKTSRLFVVTQDSQKVDVVESGATTSTALSLPDLDGPAAIGVDSRKGLAYVANENNDTVTVFDTMSGTESGSPLVLHDDGPDGVAVDEQTQTVYVANYVSNNVSVIDEGARPVVTTSFAVGEQPSSVAVDLNAHTIWVANQSDASVSVVQQSVSPTIVSGDPTAGTVGSPYAFTFSATGVSSAPMSYSLSGSVPAGLTLTNGVLAGTPTAAGDFVITLTASNGVDPDATVTYTLHVDAAAVIPPTNPPTMPPITTPTTTGAHLPTVAG